MGMFDEQTLGTPPISFKRARKGTEFSGVILPIRQKNRRTGVWDLVAYREDQDKDRTTGEPKVYPSGDPVLVGQFHLQTELKNWDLTSAEFEERTAEFPDETDTGLRRLFIGSKYLNQAVRATFKRLRKAPEVGGHLTVRVLGIKSDIAKNGEKYTYPDVAVEWTPADAEGRKVAEAYAATLPEPEDAPSRMTGDEPEPEV